MTTALGDPPGRDQPDGAAPAPDTPDSDTTNPDTPDSDTANPDTANPDIPDAHGLVIHEPASPQQNPSLPAPMVPGSGRGPDAGPAGTTTGHYFDTSPTIGHDPGLVEVLLPDRRLELETDAGVFSRQRLDPGTRLLLHLAPTPSRSARTALDLGCGYGPIALTLASALPEATVHAIDVNERALDLCGRNARRNGCPNVVVSTPDAVTDDVRFDLIWSNPPIRIGKPALRALLTTWLTRLTPEGLAVLVVQRHLGADSLQRWLTEEGHPCERMASKQGFRILGVRAAP